MTLRQLRQVASELGVTLYSRKTKEELVSAIGQRQGGLAEGDEVVLSDMSAWDQFDRIRLR